MFILSEILRKNLVIIELFSSGCNMVYSIILIKSRGANVRPCRLFAVYYI